MSLTDEAITTPTFHTNEFGFHYAKVPLITASLEGDTCPLLRAILTDDLGCDKIIEVSGEGDCWWNFTYEGTKFTCMLLVPWCGGSKLYPASATQSTPAERELLKELVDEITRHAIKRMTSNITATLRRKKWLLREWDVTTPVGKVIVTYSGRGQAFESVAVDGAIVAKTRSSLWFVPRFDFQLGPLPASVEVRVWPWLILRSVRLRIADQVCYTKGFL